LVLFGLPEKISATLAIQRPGAQTEDWAHAVLDYGQRKVILHASMLVAESGPRFVAHGTKGSWIKTGMDVQEGQLIQGLAPGADGWGADPKPGLFYDGTDAPPAQCFVPSGDYRHYYARVRDAIRDGKPNPVPPAQAVAVMAVLETAIVSSLTGETLPVSFFESERLAYEQSRL
jgi:predicted dehydrogenase